MRGHSLSVTLWLLTALAAAGLAWFHKQPRLQVEQPDLEVHLIDRHREAAEVKPLVDKKHYAQINLVPWVRVKPLPPKVEQPYEKPFEPFQLTKVINDELVELTSLEAGQGKKIYRVGEAITTRQEGSLIRMAIGKIISLDRQKAPDSEIPDSLLIEYKGKQYKLLAATLLDSVVEANKKKGIKLNVTDPDRLLEHEGREVAPNSYELHRDFFLAIMANAQEELNKLKYGQDPQGNFLITELATDSVLKKFGFKERDVLLAFNGQRVQSFEDFLTLRTAWVGSKTSQGQIRVMRAGKAVDLKFTVNNNLGKFKEHYN